MITRISFILFFLLTAPALFIYARKLRGRTSLLRRVLFFLPNVVLAALTVYYMMHDGELEQNADAVAIYLLSILLVAVPELVYSLMLCLAMPLRSVRAKRWVERTGIVLGAVLAVVEIIGYFASFTAVNVEHHDFVSPDVPKAFDGYKIVHVTDMHLGTYARRRRYVGKMVHTISMQHADAVFFTGDLVNFSHREIVPYRNSLRSISAKDGVYSVMGNHDYLPYLNTCSRRVRNAGIDSLILMEREAGWHLMLNDHRVIRRGADSIFVIGSENDGRPPFPAKGELDVALRGVPESAFKVLLTHDPTQWRRKVLPKTNIQLTLSGHTHAGQLCVLGASPVALIYDEWNGMYREGNRALFISSGIGEALLPFRFGAWPKIDIITLHSEK